MFKLLKSILSVVALAFSASALAVTIADEADSSISTVDDERVLESTLHGNFTSLSPQRLLTTSVGEFQLDASARVIDRRLDSTAPTRVTLRFRNNRVFEVTIYQ